MLPLVVGLMITVHTGSCSLFLLSTLPVYLGQGLFMLLSTLETTEVW